MYCQCSCLISSPLPFFPCYTNINAPLYCLDLARYWFPILVLYGVEIFTGLYYMITLYFNNVTLFKQAYHTAQFPPVQCLIALLHNVLYLQHGAKTLIHEHELAAIFTILILSQTCKLIKVWKWARESLLLFFPMLNENVTHCTSNVAFCRDCDFSAEPVPMSSTSTWLWYSFSTLLQMSEHSATKFKDVVVLHWLLPPMHALIIREWECSNYFCGCYHHHRTLCYEWLIISKNIIDIL